MDCRARLGRGEESIDQLLKRLPLRVSVLEVGHGHIIGHTYLWGNPARREPRWRSGHVRDTNGQIPLAKAVHNSL